MRWHPGARDCPAAMGRNCRLVQHRRQRGWRIGRRRGRRRRWWRLRQRRGRRKRIGHGRRFGTAGRSDRRQSGHDRSTARTVRRRHERHRFQPGSQSVSRFQCLQPARQSGRAVYHRRLRWRAEAFVAGGGEDGGGELLVGQVEPGGTLVVEVGQGALGQVQLNLCDAVAGRAEIVSPLKRQLFVPPCPLAIHRISWIILASSLKHGVTYRVSSRVVFSERVPWPART